jgi:hypothetical protein
MELYLPFQFTSDGQAVLYLISQYLMMHFAADKNRNVERKKSSGRKPKVDGRKKTFLSAGEISLSSSHQLEVEVWEEDGREDSRGVEVAWLLPSKWKLRSQLTLC